MALRFMDGFECGGTSGKAAHLTKYSDSNLVDIDIATPRTGACALTFTSTAGYLITKTLPASGGAIVGVALRVAAFATGDDLLQIREGSTVHLTVYLDGPTRCLSVRRGTTTLATGATVLALSTYYYLELKAVIHDTTGSYELRIDGATELTASGVDTRNGGATGQWDNVALVAVWIESFDDLYICDTSGSVNNTFLGPCHVETLLPQTDAVSAGSNAGLTPSTGTDHGALVDENPPNTTDYNGSSTVGAKDTYQYPSLSLSGTIAGIQTNLYVAKSDSAARQVCAVVRTGSLDYDGANVSPGTSFLYFSEVRSLNPGTGVAWTTADINAIQAGMKVTA